MKLYTVLIVDDEPEFINIIIDILENEKEKKFQFYHAVSGITGFEIAKQRKPDIILTDWDMPILSGVDFIKKLKANDDTKNIPIIMVTGRMTSSSALEEAFIEGAVDFIRKPIEKIELLARIKSIIKINEYQKLEINLKNQELATYATYFTQNNQFLINLVSEIKKLSFQEYVKKLLFDKKLQTIVKNVENHVSNDSWKKFLYYFQQIHPKFEKKLIENYPELKPADIKLAILLRLNLSSKEIAEITFQQSDSVKTSRHRLRKKLKLPPKDNLSTFFAKF